MDVEVDIYRVPTVVCMSVLIPDTKKIVLMISPNPTLSPTTHNVLDSIRGMDTIIGKDVR